MKKSFRVYIIALLFSTIVSAVESGVYVEGGLGKGLNDTLKGKNSDYLNDGAHFGTVSLGYQSTVYRFEIEELYKINSLNDDKKGDAIQNTQMLNFCFSGYNHSKMVTTFGFGAGISSYKIADMDIENKNIFTYQGIFSIGYMINKHFTITPQYNYIRTVKSDDFDRNSDHLISLTARYLF